MRFERISIERPGAYARGFLADAAGVHDDARRGYGGQARTVDRILHEPGFERVDRIGWVTSLKSVRRGAGALALQDILYRFDEAGVDLVGLIALPDDDAFLPRLVNYYRRFGFEVYADDDSYPGSSYPIMLRR